MWIKKYRTEMKQNGVNILVEESSTHYEKEVLNSPESVVQMVNTIYNMNRLAEEYLFVIGLTTKNKPLGVFEVSHGTNQQAIVGAREIFIRLLLVGASSFVLLHNHPSGDCTPSHEDMMLTEKIKKCADLMDIKLLDHIIVADTYRSLKKEKIL